METGDLGFCVLPAESVQQNFTKWDNAFSAGDVRDLHMEAREWILDPGREEKCGN
jgi:hypothetical protein